MSRYYFDISEEKAKQSNLTVAVSFGLERDAAFEHAKTKVNKTRHANC